MQVNTLQVGPLQTNCYILSAEDATAVLIDPGDDADRILQYVRMQGLSVKGIWLTHGHYDHVNAVKALKTAFGCPIVACRAESVLLADAGLNLSLSFVGVPLDVTADVLYDDGDTFTFGGEMVTVLHTPGHTSGSCCYMVDQLLFTGDTLFCGSIGRTDFPTGDMQAIRLSLQRLASLKGEYTVLPGHGAATSLSAERRANPYLI